MSVYEQIAALAFRIECSEDFVICVCFWIIFCLGLYFSLLIEFVGWLCKKLIRHFKKNKPD